MAVQYFVYGDDAVAHLKACDLKIGQVIDTVGFIRREVHPDLFSALVNAIVGQQIATKAQQTIWERIIAGLGEVTPENIMACGDDELQKFGLTFRKVSYIKGAASKVLNGELNLRELTELSDEEVCRRLVTLSGVGVWTAEMLMLFSMQRLDILSQSDLAIQRGLRMVYHHRCITSELFRKYKRRYSPYGSVASLYLWAVAGGAIPGMHDWAPKKSRLSKAVSNK